MRNVYEFHIKDIEIYGFSCVGWVKQTAIEAMFLKFVFDTGEC